uniref:BspA family leucine-rich repeat surface protein n=1 Tax=Psychroflexus aestuariivivens TaxID=1795040 RepID=UPI000FDB51D0
MNLKQFLQLAMFALFINFSTFAQNNPNFYLENGTCKCPNAAVGESGTLTINGVQKTLTKRTEPQLFLLITDNIYDTQIGLSCTSGITDMSSLFQHRPGFNQNISHWDTSDVTDMSRMFLGATDFNQDTGAWDTSNVTDMSEMFSQAFDFNQDIGAWDTSSVELMTGMFYDASSFNKDIGDWDTSNVTDMSRMFRFAFIFNQALNNWDVSKVTDMNRMFNSAIFFNQALNSWDVSSVTNMNSMFSNASSFKKDISGWCVENITTEPSFFSNSNLDNNLSLKPLWGDECKITTWVNSNNWDNGAPNANDEAIVNSTYDITNAIQAKNLTVNTNKILKVYDGLEVKKSLINNGQITFKSNQNSTGQLDEFNGSISGNGTIEVERYFPANRSFRFVTSAVDSETNILENWQENGASPIGYGTHITGSTTGANGFDQTETGNLSFFGYDNATQAWTDVTNTDLDDLEAGIPYRLYVRGDRTIDLTGNDAENETTLRATGNLKIGDVLVDNLGENTDDFSFIGNPYQATVDMNSLSYNNLSPDFYWVWDPNMNEDGAYVTVDLSDGSSAGS